MDINYLNNEEVLTRSALKVFQWLDQESVRGIALVVACIGDVRHRLAAKELIENTNEVSTAYVMAFVSQVLEQRVCRTHARAQNPPFDHTS